MGVRIRKAETPGKWIVYAYHKGKRRNKTCDSKEEAEEQARKIRLRIELGESIGLRRLAGAKPSESAPKIKDFGERWLDERKHSKLKENTVNVYQSILETHVLPEFGALRLDQVGYARLKVFAIRMADKGLSPATIKQAFRVLSAMMNEAIKEGTIQSNPVIMRDLTPFFVGAYEAKDIDPFSVEEVRRIEEGAGPLFLIIATLARTGIRWGEAAALEWPDCNFETQLISIRRQRPANTHKTIKPKSRMAIRDVDMSDGLKQILLDHRDGRRRGLVFTSSKGGELKYQAFRKRWIKILQRVGLEYRTPHSLRHSFASILLSDGESPLYVSQQLNHTTPEFTLRVYSRWIPRRFHRGVNRMDRDK